MQVAGWGNAIARNYFERVEEGWTRIVVSTRRSTAGNESMDKEQAEPPASFDRGTVRLTPFGREKYRREQLVRREIVGHHAGLLMSPAPGSPERNWR